MNDPYSASFLVIGGVCLGFAMHAATLASWSRRRQYILLMVLSLLHAVFAALTHYLLRSTTPEAAFTLGWGICLAAPYVAYLFGELVIDLIDARTPLTIGFQRLNLAITTAFFVAALADGWAGTSLVLTGEVTFHPATHYRYIIEFAPAGQAYLFWSLFSVAVYAVWLIRSYRAFPDTLPIALGCLVFFLTTAHDMALLVLRSDLYSLQAYGFFALIVAVWVVLAGRYERSLGHLTRAVAGLQDQRARLLQSPQLVQEQKLNALGTLAAGVAHEINNPLTGIIGHAELLAESLSEARPERRFAERILVEGERVATIVRGLLMFARKDDGKTSPVRIVELARETVQLLESSLKQDQIVLSVEVSDALPDPLVQPQPLRQVLMNLLTNARDALNDRDVRRTDPKQLRILASHTVRNEVDWLTIEVRDNGDGMQAELKERIFDPFFTTKEVGRGTGLGLSISHGIATAHGGTLSCDSTPGRGTVFRLELPVGAAGKPRR